MAVKVFIKELTPATLKEKRRTARINRTKKESEDA